VPASIYGACVGNTREEVALIPTGSIFHYLWLSVAMGGLSLLTSCVFPMMPITVSYFMNHPSRSRGDSIKAAGLYGRGIMFTFVALGVFLAIVFGASGINKLASNPWVNHLITAIFLSFALSLPGVFFLHMPTGLMNRLNRATTGK
jgi:thiol:disulfide interchange protein